MTEELEELKRKIPKSQLQQGDNLISLHFRNPKDMNIMRDIMELGLQSNEIYNYLAIRLEEGRKQKPERRPSNEEINRFLQFSPEDCPVELPARKLLPIEEDIRRKRKGRRFIKG